MYKVYYTPSHARAGERVTHVAMCERIFRATLFAVALSVYFTVSRCPFEYGLRYKTRKPQSHTLNTVRPMVVSYSLYTHGACPQRQRLKRRGVSPLPQNEPSARTVHPPHPSLTTPSTPSAARSALTRASQHSRQAHGRALPRLLTPQAQRAPCVARWRACPAWSPSCAQAK